MYRPIFDTCEEFVFAKYVRMSMIEFWNPWLRQVKRFKYKYKDNWYDTTKPEKAYKVLGKFFGPIDSDGKAAIFDCASQVFKFIDLHDSVRITTHEQSTVSLNGNLYWVYVNHETDEYFIQSFDFSMETFKPFCLLPCQKSDDLDELLVLAAYKADRLSLLKRTYLTKNIEIWVTKNKICREEKDVVWIKLMTLPTSNLPRRFSLLQGINYIIYDKTLYMCCNDLGTGFGCIYIVTEDICKRIQIGSGIVYCRYSFYPPNFISVPYFGG